jgi:broad specificity phosphatase PhoE
MRRGRVVPSDAADSAPRYWIGSTVWHHRRMGSLFFITHPEVTIDPGTEVARWHLSDIGVSRMRRFARSEVVRDVSAVWASTETKAIEAAGLLAGWLGLPVSTCAALGENDRSATGFLPPDEFERMADAFIAEPGRSVRGWERAIDAQARVRAAADAIIAGHGGGDLAIVAHGAVGTLLLCSYLDRPIARSADQPAQGCYWTATLPDCRVVHVWRPI